MTPRENTLNILTNEWIRQFNTNLQVRRALDQAVIHTMKTEESDLEEWHNLNEQASNAQAIQTTLTQIALSLGYTMKEFNHALINNYTAQKEEA